MSSTTPTRSPNPTTVKTPSASPDETALPQVQQPAAAAAASSNGTADHNSARRPSFNFLRRQKSSESRSSGQRIASGGKMSKKQKALAQEEALRKQREAAMLPKQPPRLPSHSPLPQMDNFGGEEARPDSVAIVSNRAGSYGQNPNFSRPSGDYKMAQGASGVPVPPVPGSSPSYMDFDPYPRTESMTHRGRYSYASSAISSINSPRRVRRRKDPTPFNILVIGAKNSGKSSFIEFLRTALALPAKKRPSTPTPPATTVPADSPFTSEYLETEVDQERIGVTLWDSEGLEKHVVDFQLPVVTSFLESKFEETFSEEQKVIRAPGVRDTHIHCVFLLLDPSRLDSNMSDWRKKASRIPGGNQTSGVLDQDLDLNVLRELQGKTTVIPVISKADTITSAHMRYLKKTVWDCLKKAKLDPLEALSLSESDAEDDDEGFDERDEDAYLQSSSDTEGKSDMINKLLDRSSSDAASDSSTSSAPHTSSPPAGGKRSHTRKASAMSASLEKDDPELPYFPFSIISPDPYDPSVIGRKFPWGFADPYNPEHCDFVRLRESVFSEWRSELREASREQWYEGWRTSRLQKGSRNRRIATAGGVPGNNLTPPSVNGRAASAGRDHRQARSAGN